MPTAFCSALHWRTLAEARVPFELPSEQERAARVSSVLSVLYLIFNEGYSATSGEEWMRPALSNDALRLGRILAELVPQESEVHGLVALMEFRHPAPGPAPGWMANRSRYWIKTAGFGSAWLCRTFARQEIWGGSGAVCLTGCNCCMPCIGTYCTRNKLGAYCCALRCACTAFTFPHS